MLKTPPGQGKPPGIEPPPALNRVESLIDKMIFKILWRNKEQGNMVADGLKGLPPDFSILQARMQSGVRILTVDPYSNSITVSPSIRTVKEGIVYDVNQYERAERDDGWPVIFIDCDDIAGLVAYNPNPRQGIEDNAVAETGPDRVAETPDPKKVEVEPKTGQKPKLIV